MPDVDLVVAGAGGGLAGALRAAQHGLTVLVVDADEHFRRGNNTAMSTAMVPGPGSRFQRAAGVEDSPELFLRDVAAKTGGAADPLVAPALARVGAPLVEWLADHVGVPVELPTDFAYPGHSVRRVHTVPGRRGAALLHHLAEAAAADDRVDLLVPARLTGVEDGVAVLEQPDGSTETVSCRAVLLATNGFGADPDLVAEHLPEIAGAAYHGGPHSRGDALRIGTALGAATACLDAYQGHGALSSAAQTLVTWAAVMHGAVVVDAEGRRFGDETAGYSDFAPLLAARSGGRGWMVLDERIDGLCRPFGDYADLAESGALREAGSVEELAAVLGVDASVLDAELAPARGPGADPHGRAFEAPLRPPYRAVAIVPALFHTQGGLRVDGHARVLDEAGHPLPGLYASGGAAVGISGHGATGYLAGNGLLPALGLAYLAADHLATITTHLW